MIRSPFFPALFAFLFSSLFSFASTAVEGNWERIDGGARMKLKLSADGRLNAHLSERAAPRSVSHRSAQNTPLPLRSFRRWLRAMRSGGPQNVFRVDETNRPLGRVELSGSDRLCLFHAQSRARSEWRRIS